MTYHEAQEEYRNARRCRKENVELLLRDIFGLEVITKPNLCESCIHAATEEDPGCWVARNEGHEDKYPIINCNFYEEKEWWV